MNLRSRINRTPVMKPKIFLKKLRFYLALKDDCDAKHNLGVIGVGTAHNDKGVLDAKQELCDLIKRQGGDLHNVPGFVLSRNGRTSYGNGSGYRGWKNFGNQKAALSYLAQYLTLAECEEDTETAPETKKAVGETKRPSHAEANRVSSEQFAQTHAQILLNIGFTDAAKWVIFNDKKIQDIGDDAQVWQELKGPKNALYAFCVDSEVLYVGKTARSLEKRFIGYRDPGKTKATNQKCHKEIRRQLEANKTVRILVLLDQTLLHWGDFRISLAAGLEDSLVEKLRPPLNGRNAKYLKTESEQLEEESPN